jgi:hypothetical protein
MEPLDPFVGTWTLDVASSQFDANHNPRAGIMVFERGAHGDYSMTAEGIDGNGQRVVERPQRLVPDGREYPLTDFAGLVVSTTRDDARTLRSECRRQDGSIVGRGVFTVAPDGRSLTAANSGFDRQLREFTQTTVWRRQDA